MKYLWNIVLVDFIVIILFLRKSTRRLKARHSQPNTTEWRNVFSYAGGETPASQLFNSLILMYLPVTLN